MAIDFAVVPELLGCFWVDISAPRSKSLHDRGETIGPELEGFDHGFDRRVSSANVARR